MEFNPRPDSIEADPASEIKTSRDGGLLEQKLGEAAMAVSQPETSNDHRETTAGDGLDSVTRAIELYISGMTMKQASREMDMSEA